MERTKNPNINTRTYWNNLYGSKDKREQYAIQGTDHNHTQNHQVTPTMRFYTAVDAVEPGDKVLDIGCGVGVFTKLVKDMHPDCEVWGVDISDQAMHDNTMERPDIKYLPRVVGDLYDVPDNYFDVVFSGETLEHLDDPKLLFQDAQRVLKPGGKLIITTPNGTHIQSEEHTWIFDHADIEKLYREHGFERGRFVYLPDMEHIAIIFAIGVKQ